MGTFIIVIITIFFADKFLGGVLFNSAIDKIKGLFLR